MVRLISITIVRKKACIISKIAEDWWYTFKEQNYEMIQKFRPNAFNEFPKIIDCYNKDLGCNAYACPKCDTKLDFLCVIT